MKTEFIDVSDTRKNLVVEIPSTVVDAEIDKVSRDYSKAARIPGFRPGKVPAKIVRQRFRDQILHDVAHGLIPRAVDEALRERGVEPVDTPDIRDVVVEEGQPLKFTATFDTVPAIDPGDYSSIQLRRTVTAVDDAAVDHALSRLREQSARYDPVEDRGIQPGDSVVMDLIRTAAAGDASPRRRERHGGRRQVRQARERHGRYWRAGESARVRRRAHGPDGGRDEDVRCAVPGRLLDKGAGGLDGQDTTSPSRRSASAPSRRSTTTSRRTRGISTSLDALRQRVREDLEHEAERESDRELRGDLMKQLASRVQFEVPQALLDREIDRRVEEFVRRLIEQQIDPMRTNINWEEFRERQRDAAAEAVRGALVLDEVARRENLTVSEADVDDEIARYAERTGRTPAAVRARLEKEGGFGRLYSGLRRERAIDFLVSRATIVQT